MTSWSLDDINWEEFDATRVDPSVIRLAKAASIVERNVAVYAEYMRNVFSGDADIIDLLRIWLADEVQHGNALGRWAGMADPSFDFEASTRRFATEYSLPLDSDISVRGSRTGELVARCAVEAGTSSHYWAIGDSTDEPVLKEICHLIARDEVRHYRQFRDRIGRYTGLEGIGFWRRLWIAAARIAESDDDELAFAYYCANGNGDAYRRERYRCAYIADSYPRYRRDHITRGLTLLFRAVDLKPNGLLLKTTSRMAHLFMHNRGRRCAAAMRRPAPHRMQPAMRPQPVPLPGRRNQMP